MIKIITISLCVLLLAACQNSGSEQPNRPQSSIDSTEQDNLMTIKKLDIQGHRGCRGLMPENSLEGFRKAMEIGVHTLELDVVVTKDKQVLVSHEPWMSHEIAISPKGKPVDKADEQKHNIYAMTLAEVQAYDCGSRPHARFPEQQKIKVSKPSLAQTIEEAEAYAHELGLPSIRYNIEIKRVPKHDEKFHPPAKEFTQLVLGLIQEKGVEDRTTVQSFDLETLKIAHRLAPNQQLALLVEDWTLTLDENLDSLGFVPPILSPYYIMVNEELMQMAKAKGMTVVPWTVNKREHIQRMLDLGVHGIISDYPDRVVELAGVRNE